MIKPFVCVMHEFISLHASHCPTCMMERSLGIPGNLLESKETNYSSAKHDAEQFTRSKKEIR